MANRSDINHKLANLIADRSNLESEEAIIDANRILTEMQSVDSQVAFNQVQRRIQNEFKVYWFWETSKKVAAVLFIPLFLASAWLFYLQIYSKKDQQYAMQEITSPPGVRSQVVLPDGSKVWLNSGSTIRFSIPFHKETREVGITGEAFFDVKKNPEQPFIVQSGKVQVKVLGTRFNYKAFDEDPTIDVILEKGKIALDIQNKTGGNEIIMKPGEHAIIDKESNRSSIRTENISKYTAWHKGKLVFDNTPMTEVAQMLARWYGVEVIANDSEINNYRFTTTFEGESLFEVIELLSLSSPIRIKYFPATVGKDNHKLTRSKVLISKK